MILLKQILKFPKLFNKHPRNIYELHNSNNVGVFTIYKIYKILFHTKH